MELSIVNKKNIIFNKIFNYNANVIAQVFIDNSKNKKPLESHLMVFWFNILIFPTRKSYKKDIFISREVSLCF